MYTIKILFFFLSLIYTKNKRSLVNISENVSFLNLHEFFNVSSRSSHCIVYKNFIWRYIYIKKLLIQTLIINHKIK